MKLGKVLKVVEKVGVEGNGRKPVIVMLGPPGIGKTEGIHYTAKRIAEKKNLILVKGDEIDKEKYEEIIKNRDKYFVLVELRMSEILPEDFLGIPRSEGDVLWYKQLAWVKLLRTGPGLLFIDEFNIFDEPSKAAILFKVLEKKVGFSKLHHDVVIVMAGNRPEDNSSAREVPAPVINRAVVVQVEADVDSWLRWAEEHNVHPAVIEFIKQYPRMLFQKPKDGETLENFPSPRAWVTVSNMLRMVSDMEMDIDELTELFIGAVGREAGSMFGSFYATWQEMDKSPKQLLEEFKGTTDFERRQKIIRKLFMETENVREAYEALEEIARIDADTIYAVIIDNIRAKRKFISREIYNMIRSAEDSRVRQLFEEAASSLLS